MKKILALVLAIIMMAAIAVPAFAEGEIDETSEPKTNNLLVTYGVAQTYLVSIPADVTFAEDALTDTRTLEAENVKLKGDEQLEIRVASANNYALYDEAEKSVDVDYSVTVKGDINHDGANDTDKLLKGSDGLALVVIRPVGNDGVDDATTNSVTLAFATNGTSQEGVYKDTLTFTVSIGTYANGAGGAVNGVTA